MSFGNNPADKAWADRKMAKADAERAGRLAGHKPLIERLLDRLRPHRKEPGSGPQNFPSIPSDPAG